MKTYILETGTAIRVYDAESKIAYPIQSVRGFGGSHHGGWQQRTIGERTMVVSLSATDALATGFAVSMQDLCVRLGLIEHSTYVEVKAALETMLCDRDAQIAKLEKEIGKLNDKAGKRGKNRR